MAIDIKNKAYGDEFEKFKAIEYLRKRYGDEADIQLVPDGTQQQFDGQDIIVKSILRKPYGTVEKVTIFQIKSRKKHKDFSFGVYRDENECWQLDLPNANFYLFYIPEICERPFCFSVDDLRFIFMQFHEKLISRVIENRPNAGFFYVTIEELFNWLCKINGFGAVFTKVMPNVECIAS